MKVYIYTLTDPITNEIRYVGKTGRKPNTRLSGHIRSSKRHPKTDKEIWIYNLTVQSQQPIMNIIEICKDDDWVERERYWINFYKEQGCNLTNISNGGYGKDDHKPKKRKFRQSRITWSKRSEGWQKIVDFIDVENPFSKLLLNYPTRNARAIFYGVDEVKILPKDKKEWVTISIQE